MIPLRDTLPARGTPWVTRMLLGMNVAVFAIQLFSARTGELMIQIFGFVPARLFHPESFGFSLPEALFTLLSSLFMHGGVVHLLGNMIYLAIFGNDVEYHLGHVTFFFFFLACGAAGSLTHAFLFPLSVIPSVGASGSIAGVLGAFLLLHPRARIVTLLPFVILFAVAEIPAIVFLPIWFAMQFLNGFFALATATHVQEVAGVAWWAHIGGFSAGMIILLLLPDRWREPDETVGSAEPTDESRKAAGEERHIS
jgi:membrane associated rhomboid family serine protease